MKRWSMIALALALSLALTMATTLTVVGQTPEPTGPAQDEAWVRAVHASPDAGPVNVLSGDTPVFCRLPFRAVTRYTAVAPGTINLRVAPATGAGPQARVRATQTPGTTPRVAMTPMTPTTVMTPTTAMTPVATGVMTPTVVPATPQAVTGAQGLPVSGEVEAGQAYSLVVVGRVDRAQTLILQDDLSAPAEGQARMRFVHASPDAPAVDVQAGGETLFSDVAFKNATDYMVVDAGTVDLTVQTAGDSETVLTIPDVVLNSGTVYTVYAIGLVEGQPELQALVAVESVGGMPVPTTP